MAMNTRTKRVSAIFNRLPFCRRSLPEPNGAIDQADRECTAGDYAGILAGAPAATADPVELGLTAYDVVTVGLKSIDLIEIPLTAHDEIQVDLRAR